MKRMGRVLMLLAAATAAFAGGLSQREKDARFYYDLGPDTLDVSGYPSKQQEQYKIFAERCSQCHTLARPINSPLTSAADWKRYVSRMHERAEASSKNKISAADRKAIVDFLTFDSRKRKIEGKAAFDARTAELKTRFEQVKKERPAQLSKDAPVKPEAHENTQPAPRP